MIFRSLLLMIFVVRFAYAWEWSDLFPQDDKRKVLANGLTSYICENLFPPKTVYLRLLLNHKDEQRVLYASEIPSDNLQAFEDLIVGAKRQYKPEQLGVVIVGDFVEKDMVEWLELQLQKNSNVHTSLPTVAADPALCIAIQTLPACDSALETFADLKERWERGVAHQIVTTRWKKIFESSNIPCQLPQNIFLWSIPSDTVKVFGKCGLQKDVFPFLNAHRHQMMDQEISEQELAEGKRGYREKIVAFLSEAPTSSNLANFYSERFFYNDRSPVCTAFMQNSLEVLDKLSVEDVSIEAVEMVSGSNVAVAADPIIEVVKQPDAPPPPVDRFAELPITTEERKTIIKLLSTMAEKSTVGLLFEKKSLENKGKRIEKVHPLRFLEVAFSSNHMRNCMRSIRKSHFKWSNLIGGLSRRLQEESRENNLMPYLAGFSKSVRANPDDVKSYVERRDWEGLVRYLL